MCMSNCDRNWWEELHLTTLLIYSTRDVC
uniref:Uncharacterized protein n=1 Tax=Arundo donax TaxID=35708 RepID=A0A0A9CCB8_ARUDO